jgi:hypothetical protein
LASSALVLSFIAAAKPASADSLNITYFTIAATAQDADHLAGGLFTNEVQNTLGVNGLPVLNTAAYGCTMNCYNPVGAPTDVLSDGEITYWSPALNNGGAKGSFGRNRNRDWSRHHPLYQQQFFLRRTGPDRVTAPHPVTGIKQQS